MSKFDLSGNNGSSSPRPFPTVGSTTTGSSTKVTTGTLGGVSGITYPYPTTPNTPLFPPPIAPTVPTKGMLVNILDRIYQFNGEDWVPFNGGTRRTETPKIPVKLDASDMLQALKAYRDFLDNLDGLESKTFEIVDDVIFGLRESIEALERLGQTKT